MAFCRMAAVCVCVLLGLLSIQVESATQLQCPGWYMPDTSRLVLHGRSCYQFVAREMHWPSARDYCVRYGGHLVRVDNAELNRFLVETLSSLTSWSNNGVWIGLHDRSSEMTWKWTNGNNEHDIPLGSSWSNWESSHPGAFFHGMRDCVRMVRDSGWKWHETPCSLMKWTYRAICQYPAREIEVESDAQAGGQHDVDTDTVDSLDGGAAQAQITEESNDKATAGAVGAVLGVTALAVFIIIIFIIRRRRQKQGPLDYENPSYQNDKAKQLLDGPVSPSSPSNDYVVQGSYSVNTPHVYEDCKDAIPYDVPRNARPCENVDNDVIEAEKRKGSPEKPTTPLHYLPMDGNMAPPAPFCTPAPPPTYSNSPVDNNGYSLPTPSAQQPLPSPPKPCEQPPAYPIPDPDYAEIADLHAQDSENLYATIDDIKDSSQA